MRTRFRRRTAVTTEDRLWKFVAEQGRQLYEIGLSDSLPTKKQLLAEDAYRKLKRALQQLGIVW